MISNRTTDAQDDAQGAAIARANTFGSIEPKQLRRKAADSFRGKLRRGTRTAEEREEYIAAYIAAWPLGLAARAADEQQAVDGTAEWVNDEPK